VLDLPVRVFPVGRLDRDVSGLLLLTNDGDLAQRLTHPSYRVPRIYVAMVHGTPGQKALAALKRGIELDDGLAKASEAKLLPESNRTQALFGELPPGFSLIELVVREGRHHFVKRLLSAAGHPVKLLSRTQFGPYRLGTLTEGEIRETTLPGE
jgi:pseudouridine synthase